MHCQCRYTHRLARRRRWVCARALRRSCAASGCYCSCLSNTRGCCSRQVGQMGAGGVLVVDNRILHVPGCIRPAACCCRMCAHPAARMFVPQITHARHRCRCPHCLNRGKRQRGGRRAARSAGTPCSSSYSTRRLASRRRRRHVGRRHACSGACAPAAACGRRVAGCGGGGAAASARRQEAGRAAVSSAPSASACCCWLLLCLPSLLSTLICYSLYAFVPSCCLCPPFTHCTHTQSLNAASRKRVGSGRLPCC